MQKSNLKFKPLKTPKIIKHNLKLKPNNLKIHINS